MKQMGEKTTVEASFAEMIYLQHSLIAVVE